jgi:hypothetical protein
MFAVLGVPALLGLLLGGSLAAAAVGGMRPGPDRLTAAERVQCAARHGRVISAGPPGSEMCAIPFQDGGRRCTSGSQCAGDCLYEGPSPRPDQQVAGRCEAFQQHGVGCRTMLEHGRVASAVCVD